MESINIRGVTMFMTLHGWCPAVTNLSAAEVERAVVAAGIAQGEAAVHPAVGVLG